MTPRDSEFLLGTKNTLEEQVPGIPESSNWIFKPQSPLTFNIAALTFLNNDRFTFIYVGNSGMLMSTSDKHNYFKMDFGPNQDFSEQRENKELLQNVGIWATAFVTFARWYEKQSGDQYCDTVEVRGITHRAMTKIRRKLFDNLSPGLIKAQLDPKNPKLFLYQISLLDFIKELRNNSSGSRLMKLFDRVKRRQPSIHMRNPHLSVYATNNTSSEILTLYNTVS